jgi:alpha-beta hydrolase superfamily lysophospholipase
MKKEFYFPSKDGITQIHALEWIPEGAPKAILQIAHGMVEHIERYHDFATYLASQGIYVTGHSHLGHGKSMISKEKMGYFASPNGNECVIGDIHELRKITQEKYPEVPYFLLGHSMGSFLTRQYLGMHAEGLSGAIIMGTGEQPDAILSAGKLVCKVIAAFKGWEHRSKFVNSLVIGGFEKEMGKGWLSKNEENVKNYAADPLSGFVFTLNAFYHMFDGMSKMNASEKNGNFPKELPMFFVAGSEDPVGNHGKGVETVYQRYLEKGAKNTNIKLYADDRHEILNELDRETVYEDILNWILKSF